MVSRLNAIALVVLMLCLPAALQSAVAGDHAVLVWNDLGMHCMNRDHAVFSILPPWNTLEAQVVQRGTATTHPTLLTTGIDLSYEIPGNTTSVGKTDFWDWDLALFGVDLPPDVGLTGLGLTGLFTPHAHSFKAEGIPLTPFPDATPTVEDPYQLALVIARDAAGTELARSRPVMPVSTEMNCVSSGCHASEQAIVFAHESVPGYDPALQPILCASCHASPALGTTGDPEAGYFSFRIHDQHKFLDETMPGLTGCQKCHPGPNAACLRGTMANDFGMICQDCHGDLGRVSGTIEHAGRIPWVDEPSCRECHTALYGEPENTLYRNSTGHGGVMCAGCHGSPHSIWPSRESRDNVLAIDLQGHAGVLRDCTVCHGYVPDGPGPHQYNPTAVNPFVSDGTMELDVFPSPLGHGATATIQGRAKAGASGRLLVFDARGRTVRMIQATAATDGRLETHWDGRNGRGSEVADGVYFLRWSDGVTTANGRMLVAR